MNQKGSSLIYLLVILFLIIIGSIIYFKPWDKVTPQPQQIFCTQEAKQCPDGSYVGRTGPNCEFSACPDSSSGSSGTSSAQTIQDTSNWKTYTDSKYKFSFKYPSNWYYKKLSYGYGEESGVYSPDLNSRILFFKEGEKEDDPFMMHAGNEQLDLFITNQDFDQLKSQLNLDPPSSIIAGMPALRYTTGVWITLNASNKTLLSLSTNSSPSDYLDSIISTFTFTDQTNKISPTPTCFPRPACLDTQPRCMMPEPAEGWCK